jgi:hypothetical protein
VSNFLAVATVTATLSQLLQSAVGADVPGATVTTLRPDGVVSPPPNPAVNVFLYQVTPNAATRAFDLPTRGQSGELRQRPRAGFDLHYLLSCYGNDALLEPQRLLGSVVRTLNARPMLTRASINSTVAGPTFTYLAASNLSEEVELVKFTPLPLSLEETSRLWSVLLQTPYALSVTYQAGVVLIDGEATPQPAPPVQASNFYVAPVVGPSITSVVADSDESAPIVAGSAVRIAGANLLSDGVSVRVGGLVAEPTSATDSLLVAPLPAGLHAGVNGLQVLHSQLIGTPPVLHPVAESNSAAFILHPSITSSDVVVTSPAGAADRAGALTVQVAPTMAPEQLAVALLQSVSDQSVIRLTGPTRTAETPTLALSFTGLPPGAYLLRVQVDGADSAAVPVTIA